jgi:hypothetical protein
MQNGVAKNTRRRNSEIRSNGRWDLKYETTKLVARGTGDILTCQYEINNLNSWTRARIKCHRAYSLHAIKDTTFLNEASEFKDCPTFSAPLSNCADFESRFLSDLYATKQLEIILHTNWR